MKKLRHIDYIAIIFFALLLVAYFASSRISVVNVDSVENTSELPELVMNNSINYLKDYVDYGYGNNSIYLYLDKLRSVEGSDLYFASFNYEMLVESDYDCSIDFVSENFKVIKNVTVLKNMQNSFSINVTLPNFLNLYVFYRCNFS
ncbi:hypothetical protein JXM83_00965 [Candidatus Woesearchaeota archaeon]|nr:hypothetical protein [Candidatus Woesearchaeota archaeon]